MTVPAVVMLRTEPEKSNPFNYKLYIVNIGNVVVENVTLRFGAYFVSDTSVFTYYQLEPQSRSFSYDSTRTPREKLFPRLILQPNTEIDFTSRVVRLTGSAYAGTNAEIPRGSTIYDDFSSITNQFGCRCVVAIICSYRPNNTYTFLSDTSYYWYGLDRGPFEQLNESAGGTKVIDRVRTYLRDGPEIHLRIEKDNFVLWNYDLAKPIESQIVAIKPRHGKRK